MAFKLIESAQRQWRMANAPRLTHFQWWGLLKADVHGS